MSLQTILIDSWEDFVKAHSVRDVVDAEARKVIGCGKIENGYSLYTCDCGNYKFVPFRCKSRFCGSCGYQYQKYRADKVKSKLINCNHRHIVFTIAEVLRIYFRQDRKLLNILFQSATHTISSWFNEQNKSQIYTPGMIATLHTFGRDLKWNPHIHMLVTLGAVGNTFPFKRFDFIPFAMLRKRFMTTLLYNLKIALANTPYAREFTRLVNNLYKERDNGFYVYAYAKITNANDIIDYMIRYIGRPVIAQKRILKYENKMVTFCYHRHEDEKYVEETIHVFDFLKRLVVHIPDRYFNMIRYYGLYAKYAKPHSLILKYRNKPPRHILRQLNLWHIRIQASFHINPLKCTCGKYMGFASFSFQNTS